MALSVIDGQALNDITTMNRCPLPPPTLILVLSIEDLLQTRPYEGDKWKSAFNICLGHFEYLLMPSSLTIAKCVPVFGEQRPP